MAIDDINFLSWMRKYAKTIDGSDKLVYNDVVYSEQDLFELYQKLKITEVDIRGYDNFFTIELRRETYLDLQEVIDYVAKDIVDTATVIKIRHKNYLDGQDLHIENPAYVPQNNVSGANAEKYLKK